MANFNAERLKEIRGARRLTLQQLADELGVSKQAVSKYEHGLSIPQAETLVKMTEILEVPLPYFGKDSLVVHQGSSALFFRTKNDTSAKDKEYADVASRWSYEVISGIKHFNAIPKANLPVVDKALSVVDKALHTRQYWKLGTSPIEDITQILEANGIFVTVVSSSELHTDGYSRIINDVPIIVINENRGVAARQRFSLAHELGHLVMHSTLSEADFIMNERTLEDEANLFANSFLLPPSSFDSEIVSAKLEQFIELKKTWKTSIAAMLYHCEYAGILPSTQVQSLRIQLRKKFGGKKEPLDDSITPERPTYIANRLSRFIIDKNAFDAFFDIVKLPMHDVEKLAGLTRGYFSEFYNGNSAFEFEQQPTFEQLSLFGMGV